MEKKTSLKDLIAILNRANDPNEECGNIVELVIRDLGALGFLDLSKLRLDILEGGENGSN